VGADQAVKGDPLIPIQKELEDIKYVKVPGLPSFTGKKAAALYYSRARHTQKATNPTNALTST
jgi:hypothetical protein